MDTVDLIPDRHPPMPVLAGLMDVFGLTQCHLSKLIGVPQSRLSRWYRCQGIEAEYLFLLTATLELVIEAADEGHANEELPFAARRSLELRSDMARQWLALQHELNEQLPEEARQHACAIEERLIEATQPQKRGTRPFAGKQSGSGSVSQTTPNQRSSTWKKA